MSTPLPIRANDLFISYGHADWEAVKPVLDWLDKSAGLKLWYDTRSGSAAQRTTDVLSRGIASARGALFFISPNWGASAWCRDEHEVALTERRRNEEYIVVAGQIAGTEVPAWFQTAQVLDFGQFDLAAASALLRSLTPHPPLRVDNDQDIYYAGPWRNQSGSVRKALHILREMGWRLVGDPQDHPRFADSLPRITAIIQSCRGLVALLPFRPGSEPHNTSPWVLDEIRIAQQLGRPYVLIAEPGAEVPASLVRSAYGSRVLALSDNGVDERSRNTLQAFDDMIGHVPHSSAGTYSFYAGTLHGDTAESDTLVPVIERVTNMTCVQGRFLPGQHAQEAIVDQIRGAAFMIADVTDDNHHALIQAAIARGANVPLHLTCRAPADGNRQTHFMLQDMEINWYTDPLERLGATYRIARRYRRRILTPAAEI
jgi:TIR domain-containing protein